jgi:amino acid adenylation domain-containing protein
MGFSDNPTTNPQLAQPSADSVDHFPLSFAQQRLWLLAQMDGVSEAYHMPLCLHLVGKLNHDALRRALDRIQDRHEALRTTFGFVEGEPAQRVLAPGSRSFALTEHDLRHAPDAVAKLDFLTQLETGETFDLESGPLIRGRLIQLAENDHVLLITMHHIVSDEWSLGVLVNELSTLYDAFARNETDPLPELEIQYVDYAVWQRKWIEGDILQRQATYWRKALAGAPSLLELPTDYPRPAQQNFAGRFAPMVLDETLTAALKDLSRRNGVTLYMTLMAAWSIILSRLSGQKDVLVGTPVANRGRAEIEKLIGFFVNTVVVRMDLSDSLTVRELLQQAKAQTVTAQQHQDIPFEQVVELARPVRSMAHSPLFQVMFAWQNGAQSIPTLTGLEIEALQPKSKVAKFDLTLALRESGNTVTGGLEYATALFEPATIERYIGYFRNLLEAMVADENQPVERLSMIGDAEREKVLRKWNNTTVQYPSDKCLHQLFEAQAAQTPDAVALVCDGQELNYFELNGRANQLAHFLRRLGVGPDARVAICVGRGFDMIIAVMAVLKAGGAYVPLDPAYPADRLRFMLEDSAPVAVLTQKHLEGLFASADSKLPVIDLANPNPDWASQPIENLDPRQIGLLPAHLAYVIYTSGSTGKPKGALIPHRGLCNLTLVHKWYLAVCGLSRVMQFASFSFDGCAFEIVMSLCQGASLHIPGRNEKLLGDGLINFVAEHEITHAVLPPAVLNALPEESDLATIHTLILSGDSLPGALAAKWARGRRLFNGYGPTETTICATLYEYRSNDQGDPPIGRPIPNTRIYILDGHGQPVPVGVLGELYIAGAGVGLGYLNRPELTAERFLADSFASEPDARMYRTGDLGRWLPDGNIEFLSRNDFQVKIRGFRVELGEIEARLSEFPGVREAAVIARQDTPGDKRLVAYYATGQRNDGEPHEVAAEQLRAHLSASLPDHMIPAAYVYLKTLPLTPNGKLDRRALPAPEASSFSTRNYEAPQGETEIKVAAIWASVLKLDRIGRRDNFFEIGGHSLMAVQVATRFRRTLNKEIPIRDLFAHPELADLARAIEATAEVMHQPIRRAARRSHAVHNPAPAEDTTGAAVTELAASSKGSNKHELSSHEVIE